jgi:hypothetical protein
VPRLEAAIEQLYDVFARYPKPQQPSHSPHSKITAEDVRVLREQPLRSLSGRELAKFSMKALTTWGDEDEFRHYLPRLLELVAKQPGWTDIPTLFGKLQTGRWRAWPRAEQQAIEAFLDALWRSILSGQTARVALAGIALGASNAGIPLAPLVEIWKSAPGVPPVLQLADLISLERDELLRDGSFGRRWSEEARASLTTLVQSDETRRRLEETVFELTDPDEIHAVSDAQGILEVLPRSERG